MRYQEAIFCGLRAIVSIKAEVQERAERDT